MTHPLPVRTAEASICIVRDKDGRVLTVARKDAPYEYAIPGGAIDEGETPEHAARRELFEETGITLGWMCAASDYSEADKRWSDLVLTSPEGGTKVHVFVCWSWSGTPIDAEGPLDATGVHKPAIAWLTPPELLAQAVTYKASVEEMLKNGCLSSQFNATDKVLADMSVSSVHVPGAMGGKKPKVELGTLPAAKRNALNATKFAWPEQRKFPIENACVTGDTRVALADGSNEEICDLVGRSVNVLAYDVSQERIVSAPATNVRLTRTSADVVRVTLDNGRSIVCTPSHRFMLRDGSYCMAGRLVHGASLMPSDVSFPIGYTLGNGRDVIRESKALAGQAGRQARIDSQGRGPQDAGEKSRPVQGEAGRAGRSALREAPRDDLADSQAQIGSEKIVRSSELPPIAAEAEIGVACEARTGGWAEEAGHLRDLRIGAAEDEGESDRRSGVGSLPQDRSVSRLALRQVQQGSRPGQGLPRVALGDGGIPGEACTYPNHRVVSVESEGTADVYDLTVEGLHNFGTGAGVFVHNSHVRAAASRLAGEVNAGRISKATATKIHQRIVAAGKKLGVEVESKDGLPADVKAKPPLKARRGLAGQRGRLDVTIDHPQHGHFEIRHLKDWTLKDWDQIDGRAELAESGSVLLYAKKDIQLTVGEDGGPAWNQISTRGTFAGHGAGVFSLDDAVFADIIRNYREVDGGKVSFDFEHASEQDASSGTIPVNGCPAQAWILDLRAQAEGLFALIDYLDPAKTYVQDGKYRFVSPAIRFGARHPVTGKNIGARLTSVAFTNQPFLRGLQPLAAKDTDAPTGKPARMTTTLKSSKMLAHDPAEFMPKIKACLDLHELSTPADVAEKMKALREMHAASNDDGMAGGVDCGQYVDKLRDEMQAPVGSTVEDIFDAVDAMIDAAMAQHEAALHPEASAVRADDDADAAAMSAKAAEEQAMSESVALKDVTTKLTTAEAKIAEISLELKDRETKIVTLQTENERLLKEGKERDAAVIDSRVEDAFESYRDVKKLTADDKDMMRTYCMSNRTGFDKLYPVLRGPKRHLLRDLTGPNGSGKDVALSTEGGQNPPAVVREIMVAGKPFTLCANASETTLKLQSHDPSMDFGDAQELALKLHSGR